MTEAELELRAEAAAVCADRGARWLDIRRPDWRLKIDQAVLDMGSACKCIVGQTFDLEEAWADNPYEDVEDETGIAAALVELGLDHYPQGVEHGFCCGNTTIRGQKVYITFDALDAAWRELLSNA